jgi:hypothetical protein
MRTLTWSMTCWAPDYVNVAMGDADRDGAKAMVTATRRVMKEQRYEDVELVGEGDVFSPGSNGHSPSPTGSRQRSTTLAYYRLAEGKIVLNDVMFDPDLMQVLGPLLAPPSETQPQTTALRPSRFRRIASHDQRPFRATQARRSEIAMCKALRLVRC